MTYVVLLFSLITLNIIHTFQCFYCCIEQVSVSWALATVAPSRKIYDSKHGQKAIKTVDTKLCNNIGLFMIGNEALRSMYYFFLRITAVRYGRPNTTSPNQPPGCILSDIHRHVVKKYLTSSWNIRSTYPQIWILGIAAVNIFHFEVVI